MGTEAEIRKVGVEDVRPWLRAMWTGLLHDPGGIDDGLLEHFRTIWDPARTRGVYADGRYVGTLRTFATTLSVPSGPERTAGIPTDALTSVSVAATHRRRGLLRRMLTASLAEAKERGEVVSMLRAAEWGIYGHFGYWPAVFGANYTISTAGRRLLEPLRPIEVVQLEPAEILEPATAVLDRLRQQEHGHIARSRPMWQRRLGISGADPGAEFICVLARDEDGVPVGYARWRATNGDWYLDPAAHAHAEVGEILAVTEDAHRALWRYLFGIDLVEVLALQAYPVDLPLPWLLDDGRAARVTWTGDNEWLRILDVPAALRTRRYQTSDRLVLEVRDPDGGWAAGRFLLDGGPEHAECRPTRQAADLTLSQRALAGCYLGGATVRTQQLAGLVEEETPGALRRLDAMLHTERAPWNATGF